MPTKQTTSTNNHGSLGFPWLPVIIGLILTILGLLALSPSSPLSSPSIQSPNDKTYVTRIAVFYNASYIDTMSFVTAEPTRIQATAGHNSLITKGPSTIYSTTAPIKLIYCKQLKK
jgi:hypothetical protein